MTFYEENEVLREVGMKIRSWGRMSDWAARTYGDAFSYYDELNRRGQFKLADGRVVVLTGAELRIALDIAYPPPPETGDVA
jgi:hypothetical protein